MSIEERFKKTTALAAYMDARLASKELENQAIGYGCVAGFATFSLAVILGLITRIWQHLGDLEIIVLVPLLSITVSVVTHSIVKFKNRRALSERPDYFPKLLEQCEQLKEWRSKRRLHKELEPIAIHLLESASTHWERIMKGLDTRVWQAPGRAELRKRIKDSADEAMDDAFLHGAACLSPDQKRTQKDAMKRLLDLDLEDALDVMGLEHGSDSLLRVANLGSAHLGLQIVYGNTVQLRNLAQEVEMLAVEGVPTIESRSTPRIDEALAELRMLRLAESELKESTDVRHSA